LNRGPFPAAAEEQMSDVVKVRLKEPTGGTNRTVKISAGVPASKLAPFLARQLKMNMTDEQGQPRSFKISVPDRRSGGRKHYILQPNESLGDAGVEEGDEIRLVMEHIPA
jgi:hypothetical protein